MSVTAINPGDNIQRIIDSKPQGTTYILKKGVHRGASFTPKNGDTITGEEGAVLNGARILSGWKKDGAVWYVDHDKAPTIAAVEVAGQDVTSERGPRAHWQVDLFADHVPFQHVDQMTALGAGKWFFDATRKRVYLGEDPQRFALIELSDVEVAIQLGGISNVTLRNFTVEKYANRYQIGAVHASQSINLRAEGLTCRLNHGLGLKYGRGAMILRCRFNDNGQLGLGGMGDDIVVEDCEIARNNYAGYNTKFEAGGTKFSKSNKLTIRGCYVHHNFGKGLWLDIDNGYNGGVVIEDCIAFENQGIGIYHEIGWDCVIRNNWSGWNARQEWDGGLYGAQILVSNSANTQVYDNIVIVPETGGNGIAFRQTKRATSAILNKEWLCNNNTAYRNRIVFLGEKDIRTGGMAYHKQSDFQKVGNNTFRDNVYYVVKAGLSHWRWMEDCSFAQWRQAGHDQAGQEIVRANWPQGLTDVPAWKVFDPVVIVVAPPVEEADELILTPIEDGAGTEPTETEIIVTPTDNGVQVDKVEAIVIPLPDTREHAMQIILGFNGGVNRTYSLTSATLPVSLSVEATETEIVIRINP